MDVSAPTNLPVIDAPCPEFYADVIPSVLFDGNVARLEFWVRHMRLDHRDQSKVTGVIKPVCSVVLPKTAYEELIKVMRGCGEDLARRPQK